MRKRRGGDGGGRPWLTAVGGTLALLLGLAMAAWGADAVRDSGAYGRGRVCTSTRTRDCVRDATALVEAKRGRSQKFDFYYEVELRVEGGRRFVDLDESGPVYRALRPGDTVQVRFWEGEVARLAVPGVGSAETRDSPLRDWRMLIWSLAATGCGAWCLLLAVAMRREHGWWRRAPDPGPGGPGRWTSVAVMVGGAASGLLSLVFDVHEPTPLLLVLAAVTGFTWWRCARFAAREAASHAATP